VWLRVFPLRSPSLPSCPLRSLHASPSLSPSLSILSRLRPEVPHSYAVRSAFVSLSLSLFLASGCSSLLAPGDPPQGPLALKVGGIRDDSVELGVPLVTERRRTEGWRSPVELRVRVLLTSPPDVPVPIEPTGCEVGLRVRW